MTDPALGLEIARFVRAIYTADGGELDRLLELLDRRFGDTTGLSLTELQRWRDDDAFRDALGAISYTGDWDSHRDALRQSVLRLIAEKPASPAEHEARLADEVVTAIEELLSQAKRGDAVTRFEARKTRVAIERVSAKPLRTDWVPERAQDFFIELSEQRSDEALQLQEALNGKSPADVVPGLIRRPPPWVETSSGLLYETLAALAEGSGNWTEAIAAWGEAANRSGSDRARALTRASAASYISGSEDGATLLNEAEAVDPAHPHVILARARHEPDPERRLALLEAVVPRKPRHEAAQAAARAEAQIELRHFDDARESLELAAELGVDDLRQKDLQADLDVEENRSRWLHGEEVDVGALLASAETYLMLRDQHRELHAFRGSVSYSWKASDALIGAGELERARQVLDPSRLLDEELEAPDTRCLYAEPLIKLGDAEKALTLLSDAEADDRRTRLLRATAQIQAADDDQLAGALQVLDEEIGLEDFALVAALSRLLAALYRGADWSDQAERVLRTGDSVLVDLVKARWLGKNERWAEAERLLDAAGAEPRISSALLELALDQEDETRIKARANEILAGEADHAIRLSAARALRYIGDWTEAARALNGLREAEQTPTPVRIAALAELCQLASDAGRFREVLDLTEQWRDIDADDPRPAWGRAQALQRLGRFEDAATLLEGQGLTPATLAEAQMAVRIWGLGRPGEAGVRKIIDIADAQQPPDEDVEAIALFTVLASPEGLPGEIHERVNATRFVAAFPNTTLVQALPAPETEDEIRSFITELTRDRAEAIAWAQRAVFEEGNSPTAVLALAAGRQVGELWRQLGRLPTGFGDPALDELERSDAAAALSIGAVWDPSSLAVATALGPHFVALARRTLRRSALPQSSLDDLLAEAAPPAGGGERTLVGSDLAGEPWVRVVSRTDVEHEDRHRAAMTELARELEIEPDAPPDDRGPEAELFRDHTLEIQLRSFVATGAVARRLTLPVFSDDRHVRLRLRQAGLKAFGSPALIDALERRGDITAADRIELRRHLRGAGAMGTQPTAEALADEARNAGFALTPELALALTDPVLPAGDAAAGIHVLIDFLKVVHDEASEALGIWVARVLDAVAQNVLLPGTQLAEFAARLLIFGWAFPERDGAEFLAAFATGLAQAVEDLDGSGNPVPAAAAILNQALAERGVSAVQRLQLSGAFINDLPKGERHRARLAVLGL